MTARTVAVIPARYGSTRFPGKPLVDLDGLPMIVRVASRASKARSLERVVVATDDVRIEAVVRRAGFDVVMTPSTCETGTDRIAAAIDALGAHDAELVLNVQGDEPLIDPVDLDALVEETLTAGTDMGTLARPLASKEELLLPRVVKIARAASGRALYFSRAPIPHGADPAASDPSLRPLQHVGIYAYRPRVLSALARLPRSPLEVSESLEQLRALEQGFTIHVAFCRSTRPTVAIDVPDDVARVLELLRAEAPLP
ncbi:3-deoxy-manno-octulosonate cytidylyltransferase [Myxococcota bacterium]|nr:3-deoxy-manno-octulosonate cytidylyltransferase [Myxococcota bacterium]